MGLAQAGKWQRANANGSVVLFQVFKFLAHIIIVPAQIIFFLLFQVDTTCQSTRVIIRVLLSLLLNVIQMLLELNKTF